MSRHASRLIFDSGVPLMHVPCKNVAEHLRTTVPELEACLRGRSGIGDYLCDTVASYHADHFAWAKELWDVATIAWLLGLADDAWGLNARTKLLGQVALAVLAVLLCVCSEADAFVAASLTGFSPTARLAFMVVGPMVDVKLVALQAGTFGWAGR